MAFLELKSINTFYGRSHILFDVSLSIEKGEVVSLIGRNGAGKSTTFRSIIGLTPPQSGEVDLQGGADLRAAGLPDLPEGGRLRPGGPAMLSGPHGPGEPRGRRAAGEGDRLALDESIGSTRSSRGCRSGRRTSGASCPAGSSRCSPSPAR